MPARPVPPEQRHPIHTIRFQGVPTPVNNLIRFEIVVLDDGQPVVVGPPDVGTLIYQAAIERRASTTIWYRRVDDPEAASAVPTETAFPLGDPAAVLPLEGRWWTEPTALGVSLDFDWWLCGNVEDAIAYILDEIRTNGASQEVLFMMVINNAGAAVEAASGESDNDTRRFFRVLKVLVLAMWTEKVMPGSDWDHKSALREALGEWQLDAAQGRRIPMDLWSNFHFGHVGRTAGFTEQELLGGAGLAQSLHDILVLGQGFLAKLREGFSPAVLFDPVRAAELLREAANQPRLLEEVEALWDAILTFRFEDLDNPLDGQKILAGMRYHDDGGVLEDAALLEYVRTLDAIGAIDAPEGEGEGEGEGDESDEGEGDDDEGDDDEGDEGDDDEGDEPE